MVPLQVALVPLLLVLSFLAPTVADSLHSGQLPRCASTCVGGSLDELPCDSTDATCLCTMDSFPKYLTQCIFTSCSIPDALGALNVTHTACGSPVRDHSQVFTIVTALMTILAAAFATMRLSYRISTGLMFRTDDWVLLASVLMSTGISIIAMYSMTSNGIGKDIWTQTPDKVSSLAFYYYLLTNFYVFSLALNKAALLLFYINIFPSEDIRNLLRVTLGVLGAEGLAFTLVCICQCQPIPYVWTQWTGATGGKCLNLPLVGWIHASVNVALDLWLFGVPLWQLRKLQMHWKKKLSVTIMIFVGTAATIISILRFQALVTFGKSRNITWDNMGISMWSLYELSVGIVCICLPTFRLLLVQHFPGLSGSSSHSRQTHIQNRSNGYYGSRLGQVNEVNTIAQAGPPSENGTNTRRKGILFKRTFEVQYDNSDEVSLVHEMSDLSRARSSHDV